ncbi:alpha/beta hydrolase-fold protein [Aquibium sp. ELW1220]|uniref:alpha/beta hydrolase n=1 Tax=Aquibium sp. ELW1220 TaxID=2976766 RepID=UPI0025AF312B|nr:alpha/beta hydrolase-fold protein [Aquibium sp. ELW1220]MDN2579722.1 alpha/beta hydrolase-fold protein [Aquibium sp. ELW1220]
MTLAETMARMATALCVTLMFAGGAGATEPPGGEAVSIPGSSAHVVHSDAMEADLRLLVWQPAGPAPDGGYPVFYALDGDTSFGMLSDFAAALEPAARRAGLRPAMVVAIGYADAAASETRRIYHYTPPADRFVMPERPNGKPWPKLGGGQRVLDALVREVKPSVAARYPIDRNAEMLFGHSLGGLMTLWIMTQRPDLFDAFTAASPSIWVNDRRILGDVAAFLGTPREQPVPLLLTVGTEEETLSDWEALAWPDRTIRQAWLDGNRMVGNVGDLAALIRGRHGDAIALTFEKLAGQDHMSAKGVAAYRALKLAIDLGRKS